MYPELRFRSRPRRAILRPVLQIAVPRVQVSPLCLLSVNAFPRLYTACRCTVGCARASSVAVCCDVGAQRAPSDSPHSSRRGSAGKRCESSGMNWGTGESGEPWEIDMRIRRKGRCKSSANRRAMDQRGLNATRGLGSITPTSICSRGMLLQEHLVFIDSSSMSMQ